MYAKENAAIVSLPRLRFSVEPSPLSALSEVFSLDSYLIFDRYVVPFRRANDSS